MSFPSLKLTSLQELELSYCESLKTFPEILGEMKNIRLFYLKGTPIENVPVSFQNLTGLLLLTIKGMGMLRLPSSIISMPNLSDVIVDGGILQLDDKLSSMVTPSQKYIKMKKCNLSDEFLPILVMWSANVESLDLSGNNFTILPECIKDCHFLSDLRLDDCKCLREIRGIPPNLKHLSARNCNSLTSSCRNMLLNQELHDAGGTSFCLPGFALIPKWFDHRKMGQGISFWFRNKIPSIAVCFSTKSVGDDFDFITKVLFVNLEATLSLLNLTNDMVSLGTVLSHHTYLHNVNLESQGDYDISGILKENYWIRAEVTCEHGMMEPITEIGIHFFKQKNNMEDIRFTNPYQFTNPYKKIKLNDNGDVGNGVFNDVEDVFDD